MGLSDQYGEGTFVWLEGPGLVRVPTYENWGESDPDDTPEGADCAALATDGTWSDELCATPQAYICEHVWQ